MPSKKPAKTKHCPRCDTTRPVSDFPSNKALADGLAAYCRQCKRQAERDRRHPKPEEAPAPKAVPAETRKKLAPKLRKGGRPSSITPELIAAICSRLEQGHTRKVSARAAGVDEDTLASWMHRGREAEPGQPTRALYEAVLEAEGQGIEKLEQLVLTGAEIDPHMAMRVLERRAPEDWARRERVELTTTDKPMETDDLRKLVLERLEKYLGGAAQTTPAGPATADSPAAG